MAEQKEELWSIEHTILHLEQMKETLIKKVGSGARVDWKEKGINNIRFDFDRAIEALKQQMQREEVCEWEYDSFEEQWITSCSTSFTLCDSDKECIHFCPCCGKKIKISDEKFESQHELVAEIKTNEDRIRNMPLEDLAIMLMCPYDTLGEPENMPCSREIGVEEIMSCSQMAEVEELMLCIQERCNSCIKAWLQKEVSNGKIKTSEKS